MRVVKLLTHSKTVIPLKFGNEKVILSHTSRGMCLFFMLDLKFNMLIKVPQNNNSFVTAALYKAIWLMFAWIYERGEYAVNVFNCYYQVCHAIYDFFLYV